MPLIPLWVTGENGACQALGYLFWQIDGRQSQDGHVKSVFTCPRSLEAWWRWWWWWCLENKIAAFGLKRKGDVSAFCKNEKTAFLWNANVMSRHEFERRQTVAAFHRKKKIMSQRLVWTGRRRLGNLLKCENDFSSPLFWTRRSCLGLRFKHGNSLSAFGDNLKNTLSRKATKTTMSQHSFETFSAFVSDTFQYRVETWQQCPRTPFKRNDKVSAFGWNTKTNFQHCRTQYLQIRLKHEDQVSAFSHKY